MTLYRYTTAGRCATSTLAGGVALSYPCPLCVALTLRGVRDWGGAHASSAAPWRRRPAVAAGLVAIAGPAEAHGVVVVHEGESIQAAIDGADQHTTIVVEQGTYAENLLITTDRITLIGQGATLVPPATPRPPTPCDFGGPSATNGICAVGGFDFPDPDGPPHVTDRLTDVTITGFTVQGFEGSGIIYLAARNPVITQNTATGNGAYGIARFFSTGGEIVGNTARARPRPASTSGTRPAPTCSSPATMPTTTSSSASSCVTPGSARWWGTSRAGTASASS